MAFNIANFAGSLSHVSESDTGLKEIEIGLLHPNARNFYPRVEGLDELRESIQANGLLEPLTVVPNGDDGSYRLISGHNRLRALRVLHNMLPEDERWKKVTCLVLPVLTEAQETCAIIEANRQRVKSSALLAEEAKKLTENYMERKAAGEDLPGRIRERVAEALHVSQTKLATISAIKKNLVVPGFRRDWKEDKLSESVAYEISKLSQDAQYRLLDWKIDHGRELSIKAVKEFSFIYDLSNNRPCRHGEKICPNAETIYRHFYKNGALDGCVGCCEICLERTSCPHACQYIERPKAEKSKAPAIEKNPALTDPRLDWRTIRETFTTRLKALRTSRGLDRKSFAESIDRYPNTYRAWENNSMPESETVPLLAVVLGVSTDYLFGLTDDPCPKSGEQWHPLDAEHWPPEGSLVVLSGVNAIYGVQYQIARCVGAAFEEAPFVDPNDDLTCEDIDKMERWMLLAEREVE